MKIGRKIYYDKSTGNPICDIGESEGFVNITTTEQDILSYTALSERNRDTFDVLELDFGAYSQDFAECNGYRVNVETKTLEFSYPDPNEPTLEQPYQAPLSEQVENLKRENTILKAQSQVNADRADFHEDLISEMAMLVYT